MLDFHNVSTGLFPRFGYVFLSLLRFWGYVMTGHVYLGICDGWTHMTRYLYRSPCKVGFGKIESRKPRNLVSTREAQKELIARLVIMRKGAGVGL